MKSSDTELVGFEPSLRRGQDLSLVVVLVTSVGHLVARNDDPVSSRGLRAW